MIACKLKSVVALTVLTLASALSGAAHSRTSRAAEPGAWIDLSQLDAWKGPHRGWTVGGGAALQKSSPKLLESQPGAGVLIDAKGAAANLYSNREFGAVAVKFEFLIPKGSNSGIKFLGMYEIQIYDSHGKSPVKATDSGGVYPRAELLPRYRHIDEGIPPKVNAAKPAGEWQTLEAEFIPPVIENGKKVANAKLKKAILNGQVIHENLELKTPTGHAWRHPEIARGPLMLQADHGPVAFRSIQARPLD